jgi:hypothetical protein
VTGFDADGVAPVLQAARASAPATAIAAAPKILLFMMLPFRIVRMRTPDFMFVSKAYEQTIHNHVAQFFTPPKHNNPELGLNHFGLNNVESIAQYFPKRL